MARKRIPSQRKLAAEIGRPPTTVRHWMERPDWPVSSTPPWSDADVRAVKLWSECTIDPDQSGAYATMGNGTTRDALAALTPLNKARLQKLVHEAARIRRQNELFDRQYIDRVRARTEISAVIHNTATAILAETASAAAALDSQGFLADKARSKAEALLRERFEALLNQFADGLTEAVE